jgi:hypothetical protein
MSMWAFWPKTMTWRASAGTPRALRRASSAGGRPEDVVVEPVDDDDDDDGDGDAPDPADAAGPAPGAAGRDVHASAAPTSTRLAALLDPLRGRPSMRSLPATLRE